jgi:hypothetical protein
MGRRVEAVGVVLAGFAACTTFSGGGGDGTSPDAGGDAPSAADGDAGSGDDAAGVDSGDLFDQRFDTNCNGWRFNQGATFDLTPGAGRDGGGACLANLMSTYANVEHDLPADQTGDYEVDVWLRAVNDAGTPLVQLRLLLPDGGPAGPAAFQGNNAATSSDYVFVPVLATASDPPSNAQVILTSLGPVEYYVDSVRLFRQQ